MSLPYPPRFAYYDGKLQAASSTSSFHSVDPATSQPLAHIHTTTRSAIDSAITSAQRAFPAWSATPAIERARILQKAASILRARNDELARVETSDTGKPFSETSTVDIVTGADVLEYFANLVGSGGLNGETIQLRPNAWVYSTNNPLGVCAGIGAWNYPIQIALWKSAPCLAAGNTMVYKPSEFTPLHSTLLAEIYAEAGVPPGVFNVVQGSGEVGAYLTTHPSIAKVSFTGQVSTGQKVAGSASGGMKYVTMELGGKSACVILPDADIESAVDGAMMANFFSTGQVCTNGTRVFVPDSLKSKFESRLLEKMQHIRAGDVLNPSTNFGPLVSKVHWEKVQSYIRHGAEVDKATLLYGGAKFPSFSSAHSVPETYKQGFWIHPTIFTDCTDNMKIVQEEIFGPVMTILSYKNIDEVVARANDTHLGLAAGVFTRDLNLAHSVIARLEAGITWVNTWGESPAEMSVGGWKMSGVGVENGKKGIEAWVRNKSTLVDMAGEVPTVFAKL
ncbi:aldehyde dehydrogenase [Aaosphaeria arxii CBS 175.79]|uniref:aldehyde dehydrogenase (NAD(+)) n=1 Tax=Aaosphaeria arxii CBS 175.79 TaxID=1450172 RepID=A0A6A5Y7L4_9PLEO|nr:aldehyde dehydrogenase [Aaosphaeria arxii CBS 175.79]KAF2021552.1 aldehyde dehydrogenase [Aaosphaeria arxii CBS 175.79]